MNHLSKNYLFQMIDFTQVYPYPNTEETEPTGGYVSVHNTHVGDEREKNIKTAIFLAKLGYQVHLLEVVNIQGHKNPDAYILNEDMIFEFKQNLTPTKSAIDVEIHAAKKQASNILIHIQSEIKVGDLIDGIEGRTLRIENVDKIKNIWLIWKQQLFQFSYSQIRDKTMRNTLKIE
jgi:Contact-dependent growth inhibition CdiA C-terminal domain